MSRHPVTPADRRFLRWLPVTLLFQKKAGQPKRLFRECPQLHRLLRAGLITLSHDASLNAVTINRSARQLEADFALHGPLGEDGASQASLLPPSEPMQSAP